MRRRILHCRRPSVIRGTEFARTLSVRTLSRAWQILLKGIPEVQASNRPVAAAEMVLVRLAYAADLPTPDEALRALKDGAPLPAGRPVRSAPSRPVRAVRRPEHGARHVAAAAAAKPARRSGRPAPVLRLRRFEDVVALAGEQREIVLKRALERDVRLVRFEEGRIEFSLAEGGSRTIANDLSRALQQWTGERWMVAALLRCRRADPARAGRSRRARAQGRRRQPSARAGGAVEIPRRTDRQCGRPHGEDRRGCGRPRRFSAMPTAALTALEPDSDDDL